MIDPPIHPGKILREEFLAPVDMSDIRFAERIGAGIDTTVHILKGASPITAEFGFLLERAGYGSARFWLSLQARYDAERQEANKWVTSPFQKGDRVEIVGQREFSGLPATGHVMDFKGGLVVIDHDEPGIISQHFPVRLKKLEDA